MCKTVCKFIALVLILSSQFVSVHAQTLLPLGLHPYDFVYDKLERYESIHQDQFRYSVAPYIIPKDNSQIAPLSFLQNDNVKRINLFVIANESFQSQTISSAESYETIRAGLSGMFKDNIYLYTNISLDEQKAKDESYTGKKWRGFAGGVEQSFVVAQFKNFDITVGRFKSFWGIKKSLVLSESNALDGFQYSYSYKKVSLTYRFARLDQLETDLSTEIFDNRFFAGHRLDFRLHKKLRVGLFETIIFGGVGRTAEFNYLNPLMSYHAEQLDNNVNDNSFLGFDFTYYPIVNSKLYGQVLIDDYQIEDESQGDQEPNQYGIIFGGYFADLISSYDMRVEYVKITNRTYNQAFERNRYTFENRSLGYFESNDFEKINLSCIKWLSPHSSLSLNLTYQQKGEGNISDTWTEPWLDSDESYSEPFPFGVVEKTNSVSAQYRGFLYNNFYLDAEIGIENIYNRNNVIQDSENNNFITISIYTFFSKKM